MNFLESWVNTPLANAVGWALFHSLWEGAFIAAALVVLLRFVRSSNIRYWIACLALTAIVSAFAATLIYFLPASGRSLAVTQAPVFPVWRVVAELGAGSGEAPLALAIPWLAPLWLTGVGLFYLRHTAGWISANRLRRRGVCCAPEAWQNRFSQLAAALRVSKPVRLLESCLAEAPMVIGHFRPVVLIPVGMLAGLPADQAEAILLHELAHIARYDYLLNVCQRLIEGLLFYHPAVWWISHVIRTERENCCDDAVVAWSGDAHGYAVALTALEQNRCSGREPAVAATGGSLVKRIHRLFYPGIPNGNWTSVLAAAVLMAGAAAALTAWQPQLSPPENSPESASSKWLDQDVVYIISDQERAAFEKLASDPERTKFIEQFWLRRDPTPGTPENEFKTEHYRRIAFANTHYRSASGRPGWQAIAGTFISSTGRRTRWKLIPAALRARIRLRPGDTGT